ncbi:hypothetical protein Pmani_021763 [Petrolisthes manimaculis]|uniref:Uncharacterized protein n=1 Tax=Petrolisthes manimaculis TaxID=1843537 RepID=A0AAE1PE85_9EUCA|nr:hypothetical protein Pmani_021763 [Petrolisthes manimaculis]
MGVRIGRLVWVEGRWIGGEGARGMGRGGVGEVDRARVGIVDVRGELREEWGGVGLGKGEERVEWGVSGDYG